MPNIVEYSATGEITPSDKGIQAAEMAGRRIGQFYHQIGSDIRSTANAVENHMEVMETSEIYKTGTELRLNLQTRYDKESALPENRNDPHFGDRFMAEVGPQLDQWGAGASTDHTKQLAATLKAGIRNEIFNHVSAGQSEMDAAHVEDNLTQTINSLGAGLALDPSEPNLDRTLGTAKNAIQGMTMAIPDVSTREQVASQMTARAFPQLVLQRYNMVGLSIKNQIAETGADTSPAVDQLDKDITNQVGFQYLSPEQQTRVSEVKDEAIRQGQELYSSKQATAKSQMVDEGKAAYAEIHNVATNLALEGKPPTPEIVAAAQAYAKKYGTTNPGEVASLDDYILRGQDRAQNNAVQPFNQQTRDNIQVSMGLPRGDPRRPTEASLLKDYSHGLITKEDLSSYTEILGKLDKPETDPSFKPAWDGFMRWQNLMVGSLGGKNAFGGDLPGTAAARAQFIHDTTTNFMARGHNGQGWDNALNGVTDVHSASGFTDKMIKVYKDAAARPDAADWLKNHWATFNSDGSLTWPAGHPPQAAPTHGAAPATTPAADLKKADEIIWGKH